MYASFLNARKANEIHKTTTSPNNSDFITVKQSNKCFINPA